MFQGDLNKAEIYEQLIRCIDATRLAVKQLKSYYRDNKKEGRLGDDQWHLMKENVVKSLAELEEYFNLPIVLHSDVQWKIPYDVVDKQYSHSYTPIDTTLRTLIATSRINWCWCRWRWSRPRLNVTISRGLRTTYSRIDVHIKYSQISITTRYGELVALVGKVDRVDLPPQVVNAHHHLLDVRAVEQLSLVAVRSTSQDERAIQLTELTGVQEGRLARRLQVGVPIHRRDELARLQVPNLELVGLRPTRRQDVALVQVDAIPANQGSIYALCGFLVAQVPQYDAVVPPTRQQHTWVLLVELYRVHTRTVPRWDGLLTTQLEVHAPLLLVVDLDDGFGATHGQLRGVAVVIDAIELRVERVILHRAQTLPTRQVVVLHLALRVGCHEDVAGLELRCLRAPLHIRKGHIGARRVNHVGQFALLDIKHPDLTIFAGARDVLVLQVELGAVDLRVRLTQTVAVRDLDGRLWVMLDGLRVTNGSFFFDLVRLFLRLLGSLSLFGCLFHFIIIELKYINIYKVLNMTSF